MSVSDDHISELSPAPEVRTPTAEVRPIAKGRRLGATPVAAAGFAGGIVYAWVEAIFRILGTKTTFAAHYRLWQPRDGFITAMWLTGMALGLIVFLVLGFVVWKRRERIGSLRLWAIAFAVSAILAPIVGEYGTPFGHI